MQPRGQLTLVILDYEGFAEAGNNSPSHEVQQAPLRVA